MTPENIIKNNIVEFCRQRPGGHVLRSVYDVEVFKTELRSFEEKEPILIRLKSVSRDGKNILYGACRGEKDSCVQPILIREWLLKEAAVELKKGWRSRKRKWGVA